MLQRNGLFLPVYAGINIVSSFSLILFVDGKYDLVKGFNFLFYKNIFAFSNVITKEDGLYQKNTSLLFSNMIGLKEGTVSDQMSVRC